MAHFRKSFPSRFMQSTDLDDGPITATIKEVTQENLGTKEKPDEKPVARFEEETLKPVVLNITRCEAIAEIAGSEDMDDWSGVRIQLAKGWTRYQGKKVACIEVLPPPADDAKVYRPRVFGQWFDGIRFYAAASSPTRSRRT